VRVANAQAAVVEALRLLEDVSAAEGMGEAGGRFAATHRGATRRTLEALAPMLARLPARPRREAVNEG
jgi:hypothetical protein